MNIEHIFVINLKNRTDRWKIIQNDFKNTNFKLQRWDATYGKNLSEKEIINTTSNFCNNFCSYGMIGCWLSHYKLWKYIVKNNLNNVLILEDDAKPTKNFMVKLNKIMAIIPKNYDLVYWGCTGSCDDIFDVTIDLILNRKNKNAIINGKKIDELMIPSMPLGTHAYLISNSGARKLLSYDELKKVRYHIDQGLSMYVYNNDKDFNMYAVRDPLIMQSSTNDISSSDLLVNEHPILNYFLSKIRVSGNYSLDYVMSVQILHIRKFNINVTSFTIFFSLISFLIGMFGSIDMMRNYMYSMILLNVMEVLIRKKTNYSTVSFEILMIIVFLYLGSRLNKNNLII